MDYKTMRLEKQNEVGSFGFLWGYQGREELKDYFQCETVAEEERHVVNYYVNLAIFFGVEHLVLDAISEFIKDNIGGLSTSEHTIGMIKKLEG